MQFENRTSSAEEPSFLNPIIDSCNTGDDTGAINAVVWELDIPQVDNDGLGYTVQKNSCANSSYSSARK